MNVHIKICNLINHYKWTDCRHEKWNPKMMIDWQCDNCGVWK